MKEKVIIFIIGIFLGAIISTGSIYAYTIANNNNNNNQMQNMQNGQMGGQNGQTPPEMPNNEQTTTQTN